MRLTWQEIQETYPNQWVYMKDPHFIHGELMSGEVIFVCTDPWDINRFVEENPDKDPQYSAEYYTGEPIGVDVFNDYEMEVSLAEPEVFADAI